MTDLFPLIIIAALAFIAPAVLRVVPDRSRYAVFKAGHFVELKGPGILVKLPAREQKWVRISVGDRADMIDLRQAAINGVNLPVEVKQGERNAVEMRVSGFSGNQFVVLAYKA